MLSKITDLLNEIKEDIPDFSEQVNGCLKKIRICSEEPDNKHLMRNLESELRQLVIDLDDANQDGLADDLDALIN